MGQNRRERIRRLCFLGLAVGVALVLSYLEAILPPLYAAVPGVKLGLANVAILFVLYRYGIGQAAAVSFVRLFLVALLFGNAMTLMYSAAGAVLSLAVMWLLQKTALFSMVGVSVAGGVFHNVGQIAVAMAVLRTAEIGYYMIVLAVTGTLAGVFVGLLGGILLKKLQSFK